jgi:enterochelin esterase-like enzyme
LIALKKLILIFLLPLTIFAQNSKVVTFRILASNVPDSSIIYISGNLAELGNWQPDKTPLEHIFPNLWEKKFNFPKDLKIEYKITLGSWNTEALNEKGEVPPNSRLTVKNDTVVEININLWKNQVKTKLKGQITGRVDTYANLKGQGILPRDIQVWLPPGYETDTTVHYPVLYMQDGQNLFDPATSSFGVDWQIDETADSLIRTGLINPLIIVGLNNTEWRSSEYAENDTGYAYMKFVINKVKPFIDSTYRTMKNPENTAIGGSSLGGLISFMLAWNYPDIFSMAMCVSPALKIFKIDYVDNVINYNGIHKNLKFYFDSGTNSLDSLMVPGTLEMISALKDKGYKMGKDILWYEDTTGSHNEASWARRVWRPLLFFFGIKN